MTLIFCLIVKDDALVGKELFNVGFYSINVCLKSSTLSRCWFPSTFKSVQLMFLRAVKGRWRVICVVFAGFFSREVFLQPQHSENCSSIIHNFFVLDLLQCWAEIVTFRWNQSINTGERNHITGQMAVWLRRSSSTVSSLRLKRLKRLFKEPR